MIRELGAPETEGASAIGNRPKISKVVKTEAGHCTCFGRNFLGPSRICRLIQSALGARSFCANPDITFAIYGQRSDEEGLGLAGDLLHSSPADLEQTPAAGPSDDLALMRDNAIDGKRRCPIWLDRKE